MAWRNGLLTAALLTVIAAPALAQTAKTLPPMKEAIKPARLAGAGLNVVDMDKERDFYVNVLGMKVVERVPAQGALREYILSFNDGADDGPVLVLTKIAKEAKGAEDFGRIVFAVPNGEALARRAAEAGYPPARIKEGSNTITDPEGHHIELFQRAPTPAQK